MKLRTGVRTGREHLQERDLVVDEELERAAEGAEVVAVEADHDERDHLDAVIADRAERAALIVTTNLPFSEWTTVFPNPAALQSSARPHHGPGAHH